jgi:GT2 family glycosyltransferase
MSIAIIVLTHNKRDLLVKCVENVLFRTSEATREIIIWNNASIDGTHEFLDSLEDPRIKVVHHAKNIGQNGYARAFPSTTSDYIVEMDDDIIDAPWHWDSVLLTAFQSLPNIGFLAANLVENEHDPASRAMYGKNRHVYKIVDVNGVRLKRGGPVGGGCTMISRAIHDEVGGFPVDRKRVFFAHDAAFTRKIRAAGYETAYLEDLKVFHAGGTYYSDFYAPEKAQFRLKQRRKRERKDRIKRVLLAIPSVASLNARFEWFQPPEATDADSRR